MNPVTPYTTYAIDPPDLPLVAWSFHIPPAFIRDGDETLHTKGNVYWILASGDIKKSPVSIQAEKSVRSIDTEDPILGQFEDGGYFIASPIGLDKYLARTSQVPQEDSE